MIEKTIYEKIFDDLSPQILEVINLSHKHIGHLETKDNKNLDTHFKIIIKTDKLTDLSKILQHRYIYKLLASEMQIIHSLEIEFI